MLCSLERKVIMMVSLREIRSGSLGNNVLSSLPWWESCLIRIWIADHSHRPESVWLAASVPVCISVRLRSTSPANSHTAARTNPTSWQPSPHTYCFQVNVNLDKMPVDLNKGVKASIVVTNVAKWSGRWSVSGAAKMCWNSRTQKGQIPVTM